MIVSIIVSIVIIYIVGVFWYQNYLRKRFVKILNNNTAEGIIFRFKGNTLIVIMSVETYSILFNKPYDEALEIARSPLLNVINMSILYKLLKYDNKTLVSIFWKNGFVNFRSQLVNNEEVYYSNKFRVGTLIGR